MEACMRAVYQRKRWAAAGCVVAALGAGLTVGRGAEEAAAAGGDTAVVAENAHVAGVLVNDARGVLRDGRLPVEVAARQAAILLQLAVRLDENDLRHQRMLVEAARAAGMGDVEKEALRKVISADRGDFVAQVHYIDLMAA